ncbi:MAG TPA: SMP-30/gluconolactonase/LRE family protein, partial [Candidatus Polarisedimenticolaceae bacterium]|nr:SMP-30/gluconolactonase/LRE family protein [Candidatus Polarisedimenticolaceae bacterium]
MRRLLLAAAAGLLLASPLLAHPGSGIAVDRKGEVYFVDTGGGLWKIDAKGALVSVASPRFHWMALDPDDKLKAGRLPSIPGGELAWAGSKPAVLLSSDVPVAIGSEGDLYYPSRTSAEALDVVRLKSSGQRSVVASVRRGYLNGLALGPNGSVYYTDDASVRRIDAQGRTTAVAEKVALTGCSSIPSTDGASGPYLRGLAVDPDGAVYVAASGCGRVLKIAPGGTVTTVVQTESPWSPTAIALAGKDLYVLEYLHTAAEDRRAWLPRVRKITPDGRS